MGYQACHKGHTWTTKNVTWVGHAWAKDGVRCIAPALPRMFHGSIGITEHGAWLTPGLPRMSHFGVKLYTLFPLMYFSFRYMFVYFAG